MSWAQLNRCELFIANLWRQHLYRIRRKYELGFSLSKCFTEAFTLLTVFLCLFSPEPPIPDRWEIPYDRIEFGEILGKGQFGIVLKAITSGKLSTYHTSGSSLFRDSLKSCDVEVAVKMIHGNNSWDKYLPLASQFRILSHLHINKDSPVFSLAIFFLLVCWY